MQKKPNSGKKTFTLPFSKPASKDGNRDRKFSEGKEKFKKSENSITKKEEKGKGEFVRPAGKPAYTKKNDSAEFAEKSSRAPFEKAGYSKNYSDKKSSDKGKKYGDKDDFQKKERPYVSKKSDDVESDSSEKRPAIRSGKASSYKDYKAGRQDKSKSTFSKDSDSRFDKKRGGDSKDFRDAGKSRGSAKYEERKEKFLSRKREEKQDEPIKKKIPTSEFHEERNDSLPRLNKYIANAGICSRREADELITAGAVTVNGKVVTDMGTRVKVTDIVAYGGQSIRKERPVYILLNKPKNYITTSDDPEERRTVMELIKGACRERVYPVGRLDRNTTGLLIMTNDGDLTKILTHPRYEKKKIYHVSLDKPLTKEDLLSISEGVELEDGMIKVDEISYVTGEPKTEIGIEIHSGKNRIVRRIFEHVGYAVKKLDRVYFAGLTKKDLPRGRWRFLTEKELNMLKSNSVF